MMIRLLHAAALAAAAFIFTLGGVGASSSVGGAGDGGPAAWLATGTVTRTDASTFYVLGKDNNVYEIDGASSAVIWEDFRADCNSLRTGDRVRVYGTLTAPGRVRATRIRVYRRDSGTSEQADAGELAKEIKIIVEKREPEPAGQGNGPEAQPECQPAAWEGRGLVTDIDYTARRLKVQTSTGAFSVNIDKAQLSSGSRRIPLAVVNPGDSVNIAGSVVGSNEIDASSVRVMRTRSEAENAVPQMPISTVGAIQQVDYPSMTFKMSSPASALVVSCDCDTMIQQQSHTMAFTDLRPGMRIRMNGHGSLLTGFAARSILIISVAP